MYSFVEGEQSTQSYVVCSTWYDILHHRAEVKPQSLIGVVAFGNDPVQAISQGFSVHILCYPSSRSSILGEIRNRRMTPTEASCI